MSVGGSWEGRGVSTTGGFVLTGASDEANGTQEDNDWAYRKPHGP
jgi:hypothetical protein